MNEYVYSDEYYKIENRDQALQPEKPLPDPQDFCKPRAPGSLEKVGISKFEMPINYKRIQGDIIRLETEVSCYCNISEEFRKGINMSRMPRTLYKYLEKETSIDHMEKVLKELQEKLESQDVYLKYRFKYPIKQKSLISDNWGFQYYNCTLESELHEDEYKFFLTACVDYSSTCPCSAQLAKHLEETEGVRGVPHSQRSEAKVTIQLDPNNMTYVEELIDWIEDALKTPTQVIVKREDEQEFARLNSKNLQFVEDSARLISRSLDKQEKVLDYVTVHLHKESLHSHDAVSVHWKGLPGGLR